MGLKGSEGREAPSRGELGVPGGPGEPAPAALGGASNGTHIHSDTHPAELWV